MGPLGQRAALAWGVGRRILDKGCMGESLPVAPSHFQVLGSSSLHESLVAASQKVAADGLCLSSKSLIQ